MECTTYHASRGFVKYRVAAVKLIRSLRHPNRSTLSQPSQVFCILFMFASYVRNYFRQGSHSKATCAYIKFTMELRDACVAWLVNRLYAWSVNFGDSVSHSQFVIRFGTGDWKSLRTLEMLGLRYYQRRLQHESKRFFGRAWFARVHRRILHVLNDYSKLLLSQLLWTTAMQRWRALEGVYINFGTQDIADG